MTDLAATARRAEGGWAAFSVGVIVFIVGMAVYADIHRATMPQARVETVDPRTLHISGEFIESNLGSVVEPNGSVTVRLIGQQYSFTPECLLVPTGTTVTFRATSADAIHGFLIQGTDINTMLVPGYVSIQAARFATPGLHQMPCHEYCGLGHEGMWARVKVIDKSDFRKLAADRRRLNCVDE
jgi:cytochrome c oxidase subunit 2